MKPTVIGVVLLVVMTGACKPTQMNRPTETRTPVVAVPTAPPTQ